MKRPKSSAGENILQCLFRTWLDLSDLFTDREPTGRNSDIASFRSSVLTSLFSLLSFHSPFTSTILRLSTFEAKEFMSLKNSALFMDLYHRIQFTLMEIDSFR